MPYDAEFKYFIRWAQKHQVSTTKPMAETSKSDVLLLPSKFIRIKIITSISDIIIIICYHMKEDSYDYGIMGRP